MAPSGEAESRAAAARSAGLHSLIVAPNTSNATTQICGLRVAYYAPYVFRDGFETGDTSRWSTVQP